jgi:tRNA threonylcarbamoyladenosine biosynthesis protein TsaB
MTNLLAIETATDACSAAIYFDGNILEEFSIAPREHAQNILQMTEKLCAEAEIAISQIDGFAFGCGPGSFTGLRIATSVVQGLAVAHDRPVVPISSLQTLAQGTYRKHKAPQVFSCFDARMGEIYGGFYTFCKKTDQMIPVSEDFLSNPTEIHFPNQSPWLGVGNGCKAYLSLLQQKKEFIWETSGIHYPHAYDVALLAIPRFQSGNYVQAKDALPVYLRNKVTHEKV